MKNLHQVDKYNNFINDSLIVNFKPGKLLISHAIKPYIKKTKIHPEGAIFARGACDDKGQMFMHVKALEVMMEEGDLPCNVKFMIEGEEEVGSDNLEIFIKNNKEKLTINILDSDLELLAALKKLRLTISKSLSVPAFVIFSDASLIEMAKLKPKDPIDFSKINGVGPSKLKKYSDTFLSVING